MRNLKALIEEALKYYTSDNCVTPSTVIKANAYDLVRKIEEKIREEVKMYRFEETGGYMIKRLMNESH